MSGWGGGLSVRCGEHVGTLSYFDALKAWDYYYALNA